MKEVNIKYLVDGNRFLKEIIPKDIIIVGKINKLFISHIYNELDLSRVECNEIQYNNQEGQSIKNHILSNSLEKLHCKDN